MAQAARRISKIGFRAATAAAADRAREREKELSEDEKKKQAEEKVNRAEAMARRQYDRKFDDAALAKLRSMGVNLIPVEFPKYPYGAMRSILLAEAAAAFDELTRSGRDKLLTQQTKR